MMREEDILMIENNNTGAPEWVVKPKNAFLAAIHVLFLAMSIVVHPPLEFDTVKALP